MIYGHSESVNIETEKKISAADVKKLIAEEKEHTKELAQFVKLRRELGSIMVDEILVLTDQDLKSADKETRESVDTARIIQAKCLISSANEELRKLEKSINKEEKKWNLDQEIK